MSTQLQFKTPPQRIGAGTTLQYRESGTPSGRGFVVLMHLPHNKATPFVVARWYPHQGTREWCHGDYHVSIESAAEAFGSR